MLNEISKSKWGEDKVTHDEAFKYQDKILSMLYQFGRMWDGHIDYIMTTQHQNGTKEDR